MKWGRLAIALVAVATITTAAEAPAFGGAPPPNGTGALGGCPVTGSIQFKPALVDGGTAPSTVTIKLKSAKGTSCSGGSGDGANVATVQVSGSGSYAHNDCTAFFTPDAPQTMNVVETVKYKMKKGATPAKITNSVAGLPTWAGERAARSCQPSNTG